MSKKFSREYQVPLIIVTGILSAVTCSALTVADQALMPPVINNLTQTDRERLINQQEESGIEYAKSQFNAEDYQAWPGQLPNIPFSLNDYPVESLRLLKSVDSAKKFFPPIYWERREWKGKHIDIIPMIYADGQPAFQYLYRANGENDRFAVNLNPSEVSPSVKLIAENAKTAHKSNEELQRSKQMLKAYLHMLVARNPDKANTLINYFNNLNPNDEEFSVYNLMDLMANFLMDPKVELNDKNAEVVNDFLDEVTDSPENTYHKYMIELRISSKEPTTKVAEKYFGWEK